MKWNVDNLILEMTRRCNMSCAHCLRGNPKQENGILNMPTETIGRTFHFLDEVDEITFTGGEPSLVPILLKITLNKMRQKGLHPYRGFLATNGKEISDQFLAVCDEWHWELLRNNWGRLEDQLVSYEEAAQMVKFVGMEQGEGTSGMKVALSLDQYHEKIPAENILKLMSKPWFSKVKIIEQGRYPWVIRRGNAALPKFHSETNQREYGRPYVTMDEEDDTVNLETLYVAINGDLFTDCDLSYEDMELIKNSCYDTYLGNLWQMEKSELLEKLAELAE